ncbi:MAG: hypothetical protein EOP13_00435 [Pseudomonas sp.]|nr:MAG: hypothetical protein EOP13_00435 [Pseudomonas sp.]
MPPRHEPECRERHACPSAWPHRGPLRRRFAQRDRFRQRGPFGADLRRGLGPRDDRAPDRKPQRFPRPGPQRSAERRR